MQIPFNGQRPASARRDTSAVQDTAPQPAAQAHTNANATEEPVRTVVHPQIQRQTAAQAALLAQIRDRAGAAPAQPSSTSAAQENPSQSAQVEGFTRPAVELPTETADASSRSVTNDDGDDVWHDAIGDDGLIDWQNVSPAPATPASRPQSNEEYLAHWNDWARAPDTTGENRTEAVNRMSGCLTQNADDFDLDLSNLRLTSLPDHLPNSLRGLDVNYNQLTRLPDHLPNSLQELNVGDNQLTRLPDHLPDSLQGLDVSYNQLTCLPDRLPDSLQGLDVGRNQLTRLPNRLPDSLQRLDVSGNRLTHLTDNLPGSLERLFVGDNQLTRLPDHLPDLLQGLDVRRNRLTHLTDNLPGSLQQLFASDNQLTRLPDHLPDLLQRLDVRGNRLTHLTDNLPGSLQQLFVCCNQLTRLPDHLPDSLQRLDVRGNRLTHLTDNLPGSLQQLFVCCNQLTRLPDHLPDSLLLLDATENQLVSLPENITVQLDRDCTIEVEGNPFPQRVIDSLNSILNAPNYQGPQIQFSMAQAAPAGVVRPLADAVVDWFEADSHDAARQTWNAFSSEEGSAAFSGFLDRLRGTVNAGNPQFNQATAQWLSHLAEHAPLRAATFQISQGATTSCEDRVSLTFNEMKKARLAADVESGVYDQRLPDLIGLARGMFRLDQLENIARDKVQSLRFVDEIEVYLAYQVKLRERLDLPLDTPDMRFFNVSYVTQGDLDQAQASVRASEAQHFSDYLSTDWGPWQSVVKRLDPQAYEAAQDSLVEAVDDGGEFHARLNARLTGLGLTGDSDAQRTVGAQVQAELNREIKGELTKDFLADRGLLDLLELPARQDPNAD